MSDHGLGRRYAPDPNDARYAMKAIIPHPMLPPRPRTKPYSLGPTLDQGQTEMCVGFSSRDKLASAPWMVHNDQGPTPQEIYAGAQANDEWPGPPPPYDGTSVRGAFKYLQQLGYLKSYVWATTVEEIEKFLRGGYGTVILGTNWYHDMFTPDANGFVHPNGGIDGGHAYHCFWADPTAKEVWCKNSWGPGWGMTLNHRPGCFKLTYADLATLLAAQGEAGAGIELKVTPAR